MKDIKGYEGLYAITPEGEVWSYKNKRFLKPGDDGRGGYLQVLLCKDGQEKWHRIHRLLAEAYLPNPENLPEVDHIDNNKKHNYLNNLQWISHKDNVRKSCNKPILQFSLDGEFIKEWPSATDVGQEVRCSIVNCLRGRTKSAFGYKWVYKD